MSGNNVSHSHRKTRRRFLPNMHKASLMSEALGRKVSMNITAATLRTIDHNGGLDNYLVNTSNLKLSAEAKRLKKQVLKAKEEAAA
tara:strand:- start:58 stop:315 length:258 start_codon:yes stop_codon:yes gene_type:complete